MSNTNGTAPYRGAGRPGSIYVIERLLDDAARESAWIAPRSPPQRGARHRHALQNPFGITYDCGEFGRGLERCAGTGRLPGFEARRAEAKKRGKLRGIGIANAIERAASANQHEFAEIRFTPSGSALVMLGTKTQGQGHETLYKQIVNERLGLDPTEVQFIEGDTDRVAFGMGTNGSRSTVVGGTALWNAADRIIAKAARSPPT